MASIKVFSMLLYYFLVPLSLEYNNCDHKHGDNNDMYVIMTCWYRGSEYIV